MLVVVLTAPLSTTRLTARRSGKAVMVTPRSMPPSVPTIGASKRISASVRPTVFRPQSITSWPPCAKIRMIYCGRTIAVGHVGKTPLWRATKFAYVSGKAYEVSLWFTSTKAKSLKFQTKISMVKRYVVTQFVNFIVLTHFCSKCEGVTEQCMKRNGC